MTSTEANGRIGIELSSIYSTERAPLSKEVEKAVGYVRVSGKSQFDGNGPEQQEELMRAFAPGTG